MAHVFHPTRRVSFVIGTILFGLLLSGCSDSIGTISASGRQGGAILQAESATGLRFDREHVLERGLDQGVARAFPGLDGTSFLTVRVFDRYAEPPVSWTVSFLDGDSVVVVHESGEVVRTEIPRLDEVYAQDRCQYCAEKVYHEPEYGENWVTRSVKNFLGYGTAAACYSAGGIWSGAACYVLVEELVDEGYWTSGWWECVEWRFFDDGICITELREERPTGVGADPVE